MVNCQGIELSANRRNAIAELRAPINTKEVRTVMGLLNYFRKFIHNFAEVSKPLTELCSDQVPFEWDQTRNDAFLALRDAAANSPMLLHCNYDKKIYLRVDASTKGVGGMLFQLDEDENECPVVFVSKAFNGTEQNWSTIEQEAFAIVFAVKQLEHHLKGHQFTILTDHKNLVHMYKSQTPKLVRWKLVLLEFDFIVEHIPGKENVIADTLSSIFTMQRQEETSELMDEDENAEGHWEQISAVHNTFVSHC